MINPESSFFNTTQFFHSQKYVLDCISSGYMGRIGKYVDACTSFLSDMYNSKCLLVANGTVALELALRAVGVKQNDFVLIPNISFVATVNSVLSVGAIPIFIDNIENDISPDINSVEDLLKTHKPKVVLLAHLYGVPVPNMKEIKALCNKYNAILIEDNAQSFGSYHDKLNPVGSYGDISTISFFSNKVIACGQGGALIFNNESFYLKALSISNHGRSGDDFSGFGGNFSFNNLSAALLLSMLENMNDILAYRNQIFETYISNIERLNLNITTYSIQSKYAKWVLPLKFNENLNLNLIVNNLTKKGIACRLGMPFLPILPHINLMEHKYKGVRPDDVLLPIHTGLQEVDVIRILNFLKSEIQ
jgi:perosamine synthetase